MPSTFYSPRRQSARIQNRQAAQNAYSAPVPLDVSGFNDNMLGTNNNSIGSYLDKGLRRSARLRGGVSEGMDVSSGLLDNNEDDADKTVLEKRRFVPLHHPQRFAQKLAAMLNHWERVGFTHGNISHGGLVSDPDGNPIVLRAAVDKHPHTPGLDLESCLHSVLGDMRRAAGRPSERSVVKRSVGFARSLAKGIRDTQQQQHIKNIFGSVFRAYNRDAQQLTMLCQGAGDNMRCTAQLQ